MIYNEPYVIENKREHTHTHTYLHTDTLVCCSKNSATTSRLQKEGRPVQEGARWDPRVPRKQGAQGVERHVMLAGGEWLGPRALTLLELLEQRI